MLLHTIIKRLFMLVFVVISVAFITFAISVMIPGDPARLVAGPKASHEQVEQIRHELGLDRPFYVQFAKYMGRLAQGDFGRSIRTGRPVSDDLFGRFPATIELMLAALVLSLLIGVPLGVIAAVKQDKWQDHVVRSVSVLGISIPSFWLALTLLIVLYGYLDLVPGSGRLAIDLDPPANITGLYLIDSILAGNWVSFKSSIQHLVLPAITIALMSIGTYVRLLRSSMLEVLGEPYIQMARACGVAERTILYNLALRNALIPLVTFVGLSLANVLAGAVITETIFGWPGSGAYVVEAVFNLDFPVIMAFTIIVSIAYVLVNLLVDIFYMLIDPQVREAS